MNLFNEMLGKKDLSMRLRETNEKIAGFLYISGGF